jgi:hypothetical protein
LILIQFFERSKIWKRDLGAHAARNYGGDAFSSSVAAARLSPTRGVDHAQWFIVSERDRGEPFIVEPNTKHRASIESNAIVEFLVISTPAKPR